MYFTPYSTGHKVCAHKGVLEFIATRKNIMVYTATAYHNDYHAARSVYIIPLIAYSFSAGLHDRIVETSVYGEDVSPLMTAHFTHISLHIHSITEFIYYQNGLQHVV